MSKKKQNLPLSVSLDEQHSQLIFKLQSKRQLASGEPIPLADILREGLRLLAKKENIEA